MSRLIARAIPLGCALLACWAWGLLPVEAMICVPLFLFPSCVCCGTPTPCAYCTSGTQNTTSISVTIAGVTNNVCTDCGGFLNTTWVFSYGGLAPYCAYTGIAGIVPGCSFIGGAVAEWQSDGSMLFILSDSASTGVIQAQSSPVSTPRDCSSASGLSGLSLIVTEDDSGLGSPPDSTWWCTYTGSTVTIVP